MEQSKNSRSGRPKGSKNTFTKKQVEDLQKKVEELEQSHNSYDTVLNEFVDGFVLDTTKNLLRQIDMTTLQKWFRNPDVYMDDITNLLTYYYIIDGNISQLYDLIFSLPELSYKIKTYKKMDSYEDDITNIKIALERTVKHKTLTRQLLVQLAHNGSALGTWLGNKRNPYFHVFDNLKYCFPYGDYQGQMVGVFDLSYIDTLTPEKRIAFYNNVSPFITPALYQKWKECTDYELQKQYQLVVLPPDRSLVARTRILSKNQRLGIPQGTQAIFDLQHKQKMKELERAISDKVIRAIALVKFKGKDDNDNKVKDSTQKKVFASVKKALELNVKKDGGLTCIGLPDFVDFKYPELGNADKLLTPTKYDSVDNDITTATGISSVISNGSGGNYSSANLNLDIIYRKIGSMLEQIEEIYNQLIVITLGKAKGKYFCFEYNKNIPLTSSDKLKTLTTLENQGYAITPLLDLFGIDATDYINQSIHEIDELKLREKIVPPLNSNNISVNDTNTGGRDAVLNPTNESTIKSKETGGNDNPKPSTKNK
jgi:hypothetical protein